MGNLAVSNEKIAEHVTTYGSDLLMIWYTIFRVLTTFSDDEMYTSVTYIKHEWGISNNQAKIQVPGFKASLFKSSCCNLNKILSFIQLTRDREGLYH